MDNRNLLVREKYNSRRRKVSPDFPPKRETVCSMYRETLPSHEDGTQASRTYWGSSEDPDLFP